LLGVMPEIASVSISKAIIPTFVLEIYYKKYYKILRYSSIVI